MPLNTIWVSHTPLEHPRAPQLRETPSWLNKFTTQLWVIGLFLLVYLIVFKQGHVNDFSPVYKAVWSFWNGSRIYDQAYDSMEPLYLYSPGATVVLSPFGLMRYEWSRKVFVIVSGICIIWALTLLTKLTRFDPLGPVLPLSLILACTTESVANTLTFGNINAALLLLLTGFIYQLSRGWEWASGLLLAFLILIKPQFAPLLILPLVKMKWKVIIPTLGIVPSLNAFGFFLINMGWQDYTQKLLPYLKITRTYANVSLPGMETHYPGIPHILWVGAWLVIASVVALGVVILMRYRYTDPVVWLSLSSALILVGVFTLSSLGQTYYSMWVFPALFAATLIPNLWYRTPLVLSLLLFFGTFTWGKVWEPAFLTMYHATFGWMLFIFTITGYALNRYIQERKLQHV